MPIRNVFASTLVLAGGLACVGLHVPCHAADLGGATVFQAGWQPVRDEERAETRDLVPTPAHPKHYKEPVSRPRVTLRPSSPVVPIGGRVSFEVGSSVKGFGHIYVLSASGRVQLWMENVPIPGGQRLLFPTGDIGIKAAAPAGREDLMLIVTRSRIDGFLGHGTTDSPRFLDYNHQDFKRALTEKFADRPQGEWGYARATVQVVGRTVGPELSLGPGPSDPWAGQWE
jgi:hypothetical protein